MKEVWKVIPGHEGFVGERLLKNNATESLMVAMTAGNETRGPSSLARMFGKYVVAVMLGKARAFWLKSLVCLGPL